MSKHIQKSLKCFILKVLTKRLCENDTLCINCEETGFLVIQDIMKWKSKTLNCTSSLNLLLEKIYLNSSLYFFSSKHSREPG